MISRDFVRFWEPRYDSQRYPIDFYLRHIDGARSAKNPNQLRKHLIALLHWKDGKTYAYVPGEEHAKPYTLKPILTLENDSLADFGRAFEALAQAEENNLMAYTESLRVLLSKMWNTVVIPAFLLHVARPDRLPIIDQHTVRAFLALTRGKIFEKPTITWNLWDEYVNFFQDAIEAVGYSPNIEDRCKVDRALFAWGKSLKGTPPPPQQSPPIKVDQRNNPNFWGHQVPKTKVILPACNIRKALKDYLNLGSFDSLPQYKKQNLRELHFHRFQQAHLKELLRIPGGEIARQILLYYKEKMGGLLSISKLPRPILDVFLVGWANISGIHGSTKIANYLYVSGFGGTTNAAMAAVRVGKTTGELFDLIDDSGAPTKHFHEYFDA